MKTFKDAMELKQQHGVESLINFQNISKQHPLVVFFLYANYDAAQTIN
jgi:hypothetical protein